MVVMSIMEEIKNINPYSQNNHSNFYNATDEKVDKNLSPSSSVNLPQKKPLINQEQKQKKEGS